MGAPESADFPVVGPDRTVDLARWRGRTKTIDQWEGLEVRDQAKFLNRFKRLTAVGYLRHPTEMEEIGEGIHEIKIRGNWRAAAFEAREERTWYISHLFKTRHNQTSVAKARTIAVQARAEHLHGTEEGK